MHRERLFLRLPVIYAISLAPRALPLLKFPTIHVAFRFESTTRGSPGVPSSKPGCTTSRSAVWFAALDLVASYQ